MSLWVWRLQGVTAKRCVIFLLQWNLLQNSAVLLRKSNLPSFTCAKVCALVCFSHRADGHSLLRILLAGSLVRVWARITRAHYRDFALFAFTTFTQGDCCIAILGEKNVGDKRKNVGDFLEKVQRFSENLPRFLEKVLCFWRKVRVFFFYSSSIIEISSEASEIMR